MRRSDRSAPRIRILSLIAATYFIVSGGPYGLEELLAQSGYERALLILLITPIIWSLPTALMVGELSSALPEEGGYYAWVRRALGPFWGFQEAWLSLAASIFDMAIYPTMFVLYLGRWIPELGGGWPGLAMGVAMIAACVWWNLRGAVAVGRAAFLLGLVILVPFAALAASALSHGSAPPQVTRDATFLGTISIAMWNYMGWDNAATFANEVERPQRNYPVAILVTLGLIMLTYVIPVFSVRFAGMDPSEWKTGSWVTAGAFLQGPWLASAIVLGGMLSALASFNSLVLSYSHLPAAMADDGMLPKIFQRRHSRTQAPWVAIVICGAAYASCLGLGFDRLVQIDIIVYGLSLALEFIALAVLRINEPSLPRPFRVPGGRWGAFLIGVPPMALLLAALINGFVSGGRAGAAIILSIALAAAGPVLFWLVMRKGARLANSA